MAISGFAGGWLSAHLGDAETAELFSDAAEIAAMVRVEVALAVAQGRLGVIPPEAAERIARRLAHRGEETAPPVDAGAMAAGAAASGIPVPALVAELRRILGGEAAQYVHWGATTQDIIDTGLVLRLREVCALLEGRLDAVISALARQADAHRDVVMAARTWGQPATPTTFGLRIAGWLMPLVRHRDRLAELRPRLLVVACGGASGTMAAMGGEALTVEAALARELALGVAPKPWHAERDAIAEFGGWLSLITGSLGKMGADLKLMAAAGTVRAGRVGASSTMPQKANPVGAEALSALARHNAAEIGALHAALVHAEERDAGAWASEWLALPSMAVAAGAALRHALDLAETLTPVPGAMAAEIAATGGTLLAEAVQFALARHMPRPDAQALVKAAAADQEPGGDLIAALRDRTDAPVDWAGLARPELHSGAAGILIDRAIAAARHAT